MEDTNLAMTEEALERELREYLDYAREKEQHESGLLDKAVLTLSTAGIGGAAHALIGLFADAPWARWAVIGAAALFVLGITSTLIGLWNAAEAAHRHQEICLNGLAGDFGDAEGELFAPTARETLLAHAFTLGWAATAAGTAMLVAGYALLGR